MKQLLSFLFLVYCAAGAAQNRFSNIMEESEYLSTSNDIEKFPTYDFSPLLKGMDISYTFGVIGNEYKRIRIKLLEVIKDTENPKVYLIKGVSKVGTAVEYFEGELVLQNIRQIKARTLDENVVALPTIYEGVATGIYTFKESENQLHSGVFKGSYQGVFQITEDHNLFYNDLDLHRDSYFNNAFIGTWTDYTTNEVKLCKWADFRVPDVPVEFDTGAGEFSPDKKYNNKGWKTYHDAFFANDKKAMEIEEGNWWE